MVLSVTEHALQYGMLPDVPVRTMTEQNLPQPLTASIIVQPSTIISNDQLQHPVSLCLLTASFFYFLSIGCTSGTPFYLSDS